MDDNEAPPTAHEERVFSADLANLVSIRKFLRTFYSEHLLQPANAGSSEREEQALNELELAVDEAASNVIRHAYEGHTDGWIRLIADAYPNKISLRLLHAGKPFDREKVRPPAFDGSREGGFGVYLIANSVDEVRYVNGEQGINSIYFTKHFGSAVQ